MLNVSAARLTLRNLPEGSSTGLRDPPISPAFNTWSHVLSQRPNHPTADPKRDPTIAITGMTARSRRLSSRVVDPFTLAVRYVFERAFVMIAIRIRSDRLRAWSFSIMWARCNSTVRKLMPR